ncbi:MAG TPA: hypothetical protein VKR58_13610 [Aquella sp.]|nr:hypothetical protein [Aquella sp.]
MKYIKKLKLILYIVGITVLPLQIFAITIKVAILENLLSQKLPSVNYMHDYLAGIKVAGMVAHDRGINIEYQYFPYNNAPLNILTKINAVEEYNPDVIIGPRVAEQFIVLKFYLKNILVLSPLVNANEVFELPSNFHTMSLPLQYSARAMYIFINKFISKPKHIFLFTAIDYTSSLEISAEFYKEYRNAHPEVPIISYKFLADKVDDLDVSGLVKTYMPGDIVITPNFSYLASIIMNKVLTAVNGDGLIFVGGDQWGPTDIKYIQNLRSKYKFTDYRLVQWSVNDASQDGRQFRKYYKQLFNTAPANVISYITFRTLLFAIQFADVNQNGPQKEIILKNFMESKKSSKNNIYYVYKNGNSIQIEHFKIASWR